LSLLLRHSSGRKTIKAEEIEMLRSLVNVRKYQVLNTISFIGVILVNALANILPINGLNTGEISDLYPNLFVPVPLTFAIWLVIYLGLGLFILFQWGVFSGWNDDHVNATAAIGWMFTLSCLLNGLWIVAWHYLFVELSLVIMVALFMTLLIIFNRLHQRRGPSPAEKNWAHGPFSIYFGWITVATIANVTAVLVASGWGGWGVSEVIWTAALIAIATVITALVIVRRRNYLYALVVIWTLLGIFLRHTGEFESVYPIVYATAAGAGLILLILMVLLATGTIGERPRGTTLYYR
jgi:translocator protein